MHPDLELIIRVYEADEKLFVAQEGLDAARALVGDAEAALAAAQSKLQAAQAAVDAGKAEERRLKREVESYEQRRSGAVRALEMGQGDPDAAERQITQCTSILDDLETQQLENFEAQEDLADTLSAAQQDVADAEETLAEARKAAPPEIDRLESAVAAAAGALDVVESETRRDVLAQYKAVRHRKRRVITELDGHNACVVCHQIPPLGQLSDARRGVELLICRGCRRWIKV